MTRYFGRADRAAPLRAAASLVLLIIFCSAFGLCPISKLEAARERPRAAMADEKKSPREAKALKADGKPQKAAEAEDVAKALVSDEIKAGGQEGEGAEELYRYEEPTAEQESYAWTIIKTLIVIGLLVGGFYYFFRFVTKRAGIQLPGSEGVQTLLVSPMGPNRYLQVVDLAGRVLVLGVTDNSINLIMEIKEKDEKDRIRMMATRSTQAQPGGFQEFLTEQLGRIINKTMPSSGKARHRTQNFDEEGSDRIDYLAGQRERLKKLNGMGDDE